MPARSLALACSCTLLCVLVAPFGDAQEVDPRAPSTEGRRLFEELVSRYRALTAYSDQGEIQTEYVSVPKNVEEKNRAIRAKVQLAFSRPNKLALTFGTVRVFCNGNELVTVIDVHKRYQVSVAPKEVTLELFRQKRMRELLFGEHGTYHPYLLALLLGRRPAHEFFVFRPVLVAPDCVVDGKRCMRLRLDFPEMGEIDRLIGDPEGRMELLIDPTSRLLIGSVLGHDIPEFVFSALPPPPFEVPAELAGAEMAPLVTGPVLYPKRTTWHSGAISESSPPISEFTFRAPKDYKRVMNFEELLSGNPQDVRSSATDAHRVEEDAKVPGARSRTDNH
jgi:hypothetical protein